MLRALFEAGVQPDLILGTSVGALNGALVAADPSRGVIDRLVGLWESAASSREVYGDGAVRQVTRAVRTGTHLHSAKPLRERLAQELGDLHLRRAGRAVPVLRGQHRASRGALVHHRAGSSTRWWRRAAVPGLLRPAEVDGEHYLDGGIVNSIPVGRAVECGAERIFVLQVGRVDRPLQAAPQAVGGGPGVLRDRPPAPLPPRDGRAARARHGARAADRRRRPARTTRCCPTATSAAVMRRIDAAYDASVGLPARPPVSAAGVRRLVLAPAVIVLTVLLLTTIPVWLLAGHRAVARSYPGGCGRCGCCRCC